MITYVLVTNSELLVLDELIVDLDPLTRETLWDTSDDLARQRHTLIISNHVMDETMRYDRLILVHKRRILDILTPDELLKKTEKSSPDAAFLTLVRANAENKGGSA